MPPNGSSGRDSAGWLMNTMPLSMRSATRRARSRSSENTEPPSPYGESLASVIASPMVAYRGPFVLEQPDEAWFDVNMMQKDMNLALELGRELDVPLPTTAITNELLTAARGLGLEDKDFAILFDVLARMSGLETEVTT